MNTLDPTESNYVKGIIGDFGYHRLLAGTVIIKLAKWPPTKRRNAETSTVAIDPRVIEPAATSRSCGPIDGEKSTTSVEITGGKCFEGCWLVTPGTYSASISRTLV